MSREGAVERREDTDGLIGTVVAGKYRVDHLLGRGGMGTVYQATNLAIGKRVALKFLTSEAARDRDAAERFQREALAASVVESTHIVQIFDSGTSAEGLPFLVMELLTGEDLRARLRREGTLSLSETANITAQILRALVRAHDGGIVHRDLKPDNVYLCRRDDESLFVKIVDFGVSKLARSSTLDTLTGRGTVLGTAYYMSPEQAQAYADLDGRTDLFSVGAIAFECLAGRPPHVAPTYEAVLIALCTKDAQDVRSLAPGVPESFAAVIRKALARERNERFQSAAQMLEALLGAIPGAFVAPFAATPSGTRSPSHEPVPSDSPEAFASTSRAPSVIRRRKLGTAVTSAVALSAGFVLTALWMKPTETPAVTSSVPEADAAVAERATPRVAPSPPASPLVAAASVSGPLPVPSAVASTGKRPPKVPRRERPTQRSKEPNRVGIAGGLQLSTKEP